MLQAIVWIRKFRKKMRNDHISAYSGQSAYFIILSALPFILFLLTLIQYLPIELESFINIVSIVIPHAYEDLLTSFFHDIHVESGVTLLSLSVIITIWTAGKGIMALSDGLNTIHEVEETRGYVALRIKSMFYTLFFAIAIIFTVIVLVFGHRIYGFLQVFFVGLPDYSEILNLTHSFIAIGFYISIFTFFYKFLPAKPMKTFEQIPGAIFTTSGWFLSSYIFSLYVKLSNSSSYLYGSLSYLILFFIFLYFLMYIFFLGAELNYFLFPEEKEDFHLLY